MNTPSVTTSPIDKDGGVSPLPSANPELEAVTTPNSPIEDVFTVIGASPATMEKAGWIEKRNPEELEDVSKGKKTLAALTTPTKKEIPAAPTGTKKWPTIKSKERQGLVSTPCVNLEKKYVWVIIAGREDEWLDLQDCFETQIDYYEDKTFAFGPDEYLDMAKARPFFEAVAAYDSATEVCHE